MQASPVQALRGLEPLVPVPPEPLVPVPLEPLVPLPLRTAKDRTAARSATAATMPEQLEERRAAR